MTMTQTNLEQTAKLAERLARDRLGSVYKKPLPADLVEAVKRLNDAQRFELLGELIQPSARYNLGLESDALNDALSPLDKALSAGHKPAMTGETYAEKLVAAILRPTGWRPRWYPSSVVQDMVDAALPAQEMLEALESLLAKVECGSAINCEVCDQARAAIAKAKGILA